MSDKLNLIEEYERTIIRLGKYLCVSWIRYIKEFDQNILVVAPYVTSGKIKAYHHMMYLWVEESKWVVQEAVGNSRNNVVFSSKLEAEDYLIKSINKYWNERENNP